MEGTKTVSFERASLPPVPKARAFGFPMTNPGSWFNWGAGVGRHAEAHAYIGGGIIGWRWRPFMMPRQQHQRGGTDGPTDPGRGP